MAETALEHKSAWGEWSEVEPWSIVAVVLPFFIGLAAIGAAVIAFINLKQHPERKGRPLAWLGLAFSLTHTVFFVYVLYMITSAH